MPRKKQDPAAVPDSQPAELTFAQLWDAIEPGSRMSRGIYSLFKTDDGGMHISYRPVADDDAAALREIQQRQPGEDCHMPIPAPLMAMMIAASEGKGPLGRMRALAAGVIGG